MKQTYKEVRMVQIIKVEATHDYVMLEFLTNGITISTRVYDADNLTPQEIVEKGYLELKPHIQMECDRLEIIANHELPVVEDKVISINLLGVENINFTEGQQPIEKTYRCAGHTLYGKTISIADIAEFTPDKDVIINPTESGEYTVTATYNGMISEKSYTITYKSLAEIEAENAERLVEEEKLKATELENSKVSKTAEIQNACNLDILEGFICNIKNEDRLFGFSLDDQINLVSQLTMFNSISTLTDVIWKCKGLLGIVDLYTKDEFLQICESANVAKRNKIGRFWTLKQQVLSALTVDEINEIVW